jgi:hypothetical protein
MLAYGTEAVPEHSAPVNAIAAVTSAAGIAAVPAAMGFLIGDAGILRAMRLLWMPIAVLLAVTFLTWLVIGRVSE